MRKWILPSTLIILLAWGVYFALNTLPRLLPVPEEALALAQQGVARNAEWQPVIHRINGADMVLVPAGCFMMGSTPEQLEEAQASCDKYYGVFGCGQSFENETPAHQVCIDNPFWLDLTAVTNDQYGSSSDQGTPNSPLKDGDWPRETVNWQQANDFCQARGARLPTEAEWEYAARGPDALIYPWGNVYDIHLATLNKISPRTVAEKPEAASWVGALDIAGGISEWVADWYGPYSSEAQTNPAGPASGELRLARGGNWFAHAAYFVRTTFREPFDPEFATTAVGFRCAMDVNP